MSEKIMCPDCGNVHMHRLGCPSPDLLPRYARRPETARCPDCSSLTPGEHKGWCPVVRLGCAVEAVR